MIAQRFLLAGLALLALCAQSAAAEPFVTAQTLDVTRLLPLPPVAGSREDKDELKKVVAVQKSASKARKAQAVADAVESVYVMYTPVLGAGFAKDDLPATTALFEGIGSSEGKTVNPAKKIYGRQRPYQGHPAEVASMEPKSTSGSYPSGHATKAAMFAMVLSDIVPERRGDIWVRARDYETSRIIMGMHYPSDLEAGERSATAIVARMLEMPAFQTAFAAARTELRAKLGLKPEP